MRNLFRKLFKKRQKRRVLENKIVSRLRAVQYELVYRELFLASTKLGVGNDLDPTIIVSLTSYGPRVDSVYLAIESLFNQTLKADKIVLCLTESEYASSSLPLTLKQQEERGLEILLCPRDLGPYQKFFYTLQKYPNSLLITVDDDVMYPLDTIERLYRAHQETPNAVVCNRAHHMRLSPTGCIEPYKAWDWSCRNTSESRLTFPTGVGGVLYFPGCFAPEILCEDLFLELAPHADDVWLKAMSLKNGISSRLVPHSEDFYSRLAFIEGSQVTSLKRLNKSKSDGNDFKIYQVFEHFNLVEKLSGN
jgi:hypothetical protein